MIWPAARFASTLSIFTSEPLKVARARRPCSGSPASRPGPKRNSALPLIALGMPLICTWPETSAWVSPNCSRVALLIGRTAIKAEALTLSRVAVTVMLSLPVRGAFTVNCIPPPSFSVSRPSSMRISFAFIAMVATRCARMRARTDFTSACKRELPCLLPPRPHGERSQRCSYILLPATDQA